MLAFMIGLMVGGCLGVVLMCIMFVAGEEDRRMERLSERNQQEQPNP